MIKYHQQAEKFILLQGKPTALRLFRVIEQLPLGDVKRLQGHVAPPLHRYVSAITGLFFMARAII